MGAAVTLEKIDAVRERTGATYAECWEALRAEGGDPIAAVVRLERGDGGWLGTGQRLGQGARRWLREGARLRLAVRRDARTIVDMPALAGAVAAALVPEVVAAGVLAALATRCSLVLHRDSLED